MRSYPCDVCGSEHGTTATWDVQVDQRKGEDGCYAAMVCDVHHDELRRNAKLLSWGLVATPLKQIAPEPVPDDGLPAHHIDWNAEQELAGALNARLGIAKGSQLSLHSAAWNLAEDLNSAYASLVMRGTLLASLESPDVNAVRAIVNGQKAEILDLQQQLRESHEATRQALQDRIGVAS